MVKFQENDPSLESQWRALILFGKNSATYKFAFAKSLLELVDEETTRISLKDLAVPFSRNITEHLKKSDKQGNSSSSKFLNYCRDFNNSRISESELIDQTVRLGFVNVVDAFQNINRGVIPDIFYEKDYSKDGKELVITDNLLKLKESYHYNSFEHEVEGRWNLVETAWNMNINPNLLEVKYDSLSSFLYVEHGMMRRTDITSVRDALNGYQKGKCFYSFQDISINPGADNVCHVDHFLPHINKIEHINNEANINGVWNLVLCDRYINLSKSSRVPDIKFLERLYNRNEFYIESKHPLAETIINQTGNTTQKRRSFLQAQYDIAKSSTILTWTPEIELPATF